MGFLLLIVVFSIDVIVSLSNIVVSLFFYVSIHGEMRANGVFTEKAINVLVYEGKKAGRLKLNKYERRGGVGGGKVNLSPMCPRRRRCN